MQQGVIVRPQVEDEQDETQWAARAPYLCILSASAVAMWWSRSFRCSSPQALWIAGRYWRHSPHMLSREIAEVVDSRHDKVKQSKERLAERGLIAFTPIGKRILEVAPAQSILSASVTVIVLSPSYRRSSPRALRIAGRHWGNRPRNRPCQTFPTQWRPRAHGLMFLSASIQHRSG